MKHAIGPRREIGIRTVFNILGPLTNPASPPAQLLGVYSRELLEPLAHVLSKLGCRNAMVVHGLDGLDEISIIGKTAVAHLRDGEVSMMEIKPRDFGFQNARAEEIQSPSLEENVELAFKLLNGLTESDDPRRRMVLLNAAAGLLVGGKVDNLQEGIELSAMSIESGSAYEKLKAMIKASRGSLEVLEELEKKYA
ncbi:anthranilate phosphoribosyltransferase, partial [Candidatus Bathyarchaeota archaeon]|nr:anthranilate phosphoribosyltransferase [Candidatus Bathyarchaeota archaeon]